MRSIRHDQAVSIAKYSHLGLLNNAARNNASELVRLRLTDFTITSEEVLT